MITKHKHEVFNNTIPHMDKALVCSYGAAVDGYTRGSNPFKFVKAANNAKEAGGAVAKIIEMTTQDTLDNYNPNTRDIKVVVLDKTLCQPEMVELITCGVGSPTTYIPALSVRILDAETGDAVFSFYNDEPFFIPNAFTPVKEWGAFIPIVLTQNADGTPDRLTIDGRVIWTTNDVTVFQQFDENTGRYLLGPAMPKTMETCGVPCVVFDDVGDKAEFTIPNGVVQPYTDFEFRATFVHNKDTNKSLVTLWPSDSGIYVGLSLTYPRTTTPGFSRAFCFNLSDDNDYKDTYYEVLIPDTLDGKVVTPTIKKKNGVTTFLINGEPAEHFEIIDPWQAPFPIPSSTQHLMRFGSHPMKVKRLYFNLGGYEGEFNFEEGAGSILYNTKDSSANAYITSTSGLGVMRAGRVDGVACHNAKNGCRKVSGVYYYDAPDTEFVHIPGDENGIAQDPSRLAHITLYDRTNNKIYNLQATAVTDTSSGRIQFADYSNSAFVSYGDGWSVMLFLGPGVGTIATTGLYPPRGEHSIAMSSGSTIEVSISYADEGINDEGNIITQNLNCMPGKVHNGANYKVRELLDLEPAPIHTAMYTGDTPIEFTLPMLLDLVSYTNQNDVPCVIFDDAGDKAEVTFPVDYTGDSVTDFEFKATFKQTILSVAYAEAQNLINLPLASDPAVSGILVERRFNWLQGTNEAAELALYYYDDVNSVDWHITAYPPASFDNKMITAKISFKNGVISCTVDGVGVPFISHGPVGVMAKLHNEVTLCGAKQTDLTIKYLYMNLDGYEAEFNFEEGAGSILFNTKDPSANAHITSTSGLDVMRAARADNVDSYNKQYGYSKVSGTYYRNVPNDEFLHIPADENGIAQDPTMVPSIYVRDIINNITYECPQTEVLSEYTGNYMEYTEVALAEIDLTFDKSINKWYLPTHMFRREYDFPADAPAGNRYPPRGIYQLVPRDIGTPDLTIEISYEHTKINDDGVIIESNLTNFLGDGVTLTQENLGTDDKPHVTTLEVSEPGDAVPAVANPKKVKLRGSLTQNTYAILEGRVGDVSVAHAEMGSEDLSVLGANVDGRVDVIDVGTNDTAERMYSWTGANGAFKEGKSVTALAPHRDGLNSTNTAVRYKLNRNVFLNDGCGFSIDVLPYPVDIARGSYVSILGFKTVVADSCPLFVSFNPAGHVELNIEGRTYVLEATPNTDRLNRVSVEWDYQTNLLTLSLNSASRAIRIRNLRSLFVKKDSITGMEYPIHEGAMFVGFKYPGQHALMVFTNFKLYNSATRDSYVDTNFELAYTLLTLEDNAPVFKDNATATGQAVVQEMESYILHTAVPYQGGGAVTKDEFGNYHNIADTKVQSLIGDTSKLTLSYNWNLSADTREVTGAVESNEWSDALLDTIKIYDMVEDRTYLLTRLTAGQAAKVGCVGARWDDGKGHYVYMDVENWEWVNWRGRAPARPAGNNAGDDTAMYPDLGLGALLLIDSQYENLPYFATRGTSYAPSDRTNPEGLNNNLLHTLSVQEDGVLIQYGEDNKPTAFAIYKQEVLRGDCPHITPAMLDSGELGVGGKKIPRLTFPISYNSLDITNEPTSISWKVDVAGRTSFIQLTRVSAGQYEGVFTDENDADITVTVRVLDGQDYVDVKYSPGSGWHLVSTAKYNTQGRLPSITFPSAGAGHNQVPVKLPCLPAYTPIGEEIQDITLITEAMESFPDTVSMFRYASDGKNVTECIRYADNTPFTQAESKQLAHWCNKPNSGGNPVVDPPNCAALEYQLQIEHRDNFLMVIERVTGAAVRLADSTKQRSITFIKQDVELETANGVHTGEAAYAEDQTFVFMVTLPTAEDLYNNNARVELTRGVFNPYAPYEGGKLDMYIIGTAAGKLQLKILGLNGPGVYQTVQVLNANHVDELQWLVIKLDYTAQTIEVACNGQVHTQDRILMVPVTYEGILSSKVHPNHIMPGTVHASNAEFSAFMRFGRVLSEEDTNKILVRGDLPVGAMSAYFMTGVPGASVYKLYDSVSRSNSGDMLMLHKYYGGAKPNIVWSLRPFDDTTHVGTHRGIHWPTFLGGRLRGTEFLIDYA